MRNSSVSRSHIVVLVLVLVLVLLVVEEIVEMDKDSVESWFRLRQKVMAVTVVGVVGVGVVGVVVVVVVVVTVVVVVVVVVVRSLISASRQHKTQTNSNANQFYARTMQRLCSSLEFPLLKIYQAARAWVQICLQM